MVAVLSPNSAAYAEVLARETGQSLEPAKLIAPMLARFMATDRAFAKLRKERRSASPRSSQSSGTA